MARRLLSINDDPDTLDLIGNVGRGLKSQGRRRDACLLLHGSHARTKPDVVTLGITLPDLDRIEVKHNAARC